MSAGSQEKMSIDQAAVAYRVEKLMRAPRSTYPRWTTFAQGRIYRPAMRIMHALGWCYPAPSQVAPGHVWCHWCGMRGRR